VSAGLGEPPAAEIVELVVPFEQLPTLTGRRFQGPWFRIENDKPDQFDTATYTDQNPYPFATDGYPEGLVEGFHLLALLDHLSNPLIRRSDGPLAGWNYGLDRVRFLSPVRTGEPIRLTGVVGEVRAHRDGMLVLLNCTLQRACGPQPGLVADWWVLFEHPVPVPGPATDEGRPL
jgi:acyl dehydratase